MPRVPALSEYPTFTKGRLISRYGAVVMELAQLKTYLGMCRADESSGRARAYWDDEGANHNQRVRSAEYQTMDITRVIHETEGQIASLTEERFLIEHLIDWGAYAIGEGEQPRDGVSEYKRDAGLGISTGSGGSSVPRFGTPIQG